MAAPVVILKILHVLLQHPVLIPEDNCRRIHGQKARKSGIPHTDAVQKIKDIVKGIEVFCIHDDIINLNIGQRYIRKIQRLAVIADCF